MSTNAFWDDLAKDLGDPEFRCAYVSATAHIAATDAAINADASGQEVSGDDRTST